MLLDSPASNISEPFPSEAIKTLQALEKKRVLTEKKLFIWLIVPVLWTLPFILQGITGWSWLFVFGIIWMFVVLFSVGAYIHVVLPSNEEISNQYKKAVIPALLKMAGAEGDYSLTHGLKVDSFLKSGLYHEDYSHFERADSIIGKFNGVKFGLYELAVQVSTTFKMPGNIAPRQRILTNQFYGWVLHVPVRTFAGTTYIIPIKRKTAHESDDWIKATGEYFSGKQDVQVYTTKDSYFDSSYRIFSSNFSETEKILSKAFCDFLILVFNQSANAPAFSFTGNRAVMHIGISDSAFDRQVGDVIYPIDTDNLFKKVRFFCAMTQSLHAASK